VARPRIQPDRTLLLPQTLHPRPGRFPDGSGKNSERFPELRFQGLRLRSNKAAQKSDGRNGGASCLLQIAVYGALPRQTAKRACEIDKPARRRLAAEMPSEVPCSHSEHLLKMRMMPTPRSSELPT
jgi:hypothetical protein